MTVGPAAIKQHDVPLAKDEAASALRAHAFSAKEEVYVVVGCEVATRLRWETTYYRERLIVHCRLGGLGADHDLEHALALVEEADEVYWTMSLFHHDLAVFVGDRAYCYDVPRPERNR